LIKWLLAMLSIQCVISVGLDTKANDDVSVDTPQNLHINRHLSFRGMGEKNSIFLQVAVATGDKLLSDVWTHLSLRSTKRISGFRFSFESVTAVAID
jgi:hypothetical protein